MNILQSRRLFLVGGAASLLAGDRAEAHAGDKTLADMLDERLRGMKELPLTTNLAVFNPRWREMEVLDSAQGLHPLEFYKWLVRWADLEEDPVPDLPLLQGGPFHWGLNSEWTVLGLNRLDWTGAVLYDEEGRRIRNPVGDRTDKKGEWI